MYTSVKKLLNEGKLAKWVKVTPEEEQAIIDSIPGENMVRNAHLNKMDGVSSGENLRHHVDRGYIVILSTFSKEAEKHPLDLTGEEAETLKSRDNQNAGEANVSVGPEKGVFAIT